ncbi:hypothetical protein GCM10027443_29790 [Pontibacter brevis]
MKWIDLQTGYMLGAFRDIEEMERAKQQMEAEGREVVCACHRSLVQEQAAQWWVLRSLDSPGRFLDHTFTPPGHSCLTARESLNSAIALLYGRHQAKYQYLIIVKL